MRALLATGALSALLGAGGAWWVQGVRWDLDVQRIATQQHIDAGKRKDTTIAQIGEHMEGFADALQQFQDTQRRNEAAAVGLNRVLLDLRGTTAGLRADTAAIRSQLAKLPADTVRKYADTCTAVFESMADAGARMADAGAEMARRADGHAADAELMRRAWPGVSTGAK